MKDKFIVTRVSPEVHADFKKRCSSNKVLMRPVLKALIQAYSEGKIKLKVVTKVTTLVDVEVR